MQRSICRGYSLATITALLLGSLVQPALAGTLNRTTPPAQIYSASSEVTVAEVELLLNQPAPDLSACSQLIERIKPHVQGRDHVAARARLLLLEARLLEFSGKLEEAFERAGDARAAARQADAELAPSQSDEFRDRRRTLCDALHAQAHLAAARGEVALAIGAIDALSANNIHIDEVDTEVLMEVATLCLDSNRFEHWVTLAAKAVHAFESGGQDLRASATQAKLAATLLHFEHIPIARSHLSLALSRLTDLEGTSMERHRTEALLHGLQASANRRFVREPEHVRLRSASQHLEQAQLHAGVIDMPAIVHLETAELALADGRADDALQTLDRLLNDAKTLQLDALHARILRSQTLAEQGNFEAAAAASADLEDQLLGTQRLDLVRSGNALLATLAKQAGDDAAAARHIQLERDALETASRLRLDIRTRTVGNLDIGRRRLAESEHAKTRLGVELVDANLTVGKLGRYALVATAGLASLGLIFALFARRSRKRRASLASQVAESAEQRVNAERTLAFISHDLRSPLLSIRAATEILATEVSPERRDLVALIQGGSQRMESILEAMLALMKFKENPAAPGQNQIFSLDELAQQIADEATLEAGQKAIKISVLGVNAPTLVRTHPVLLRQLLVNVVSNAVKYSPASEEVRIAIETDRVTGSFLTVTDHGPGIPEIDRDKLWMLFAQASAKPSFGETSSGVGLTLAKNIADALNCELSVDPDSALHTGATFRLEIEQILWEESEAQVEIPRPPGTGQTPASKVEPSIAE